MDDRIESLLAGMTLEEKAGQMTYWDANASPKGPDLDDLIRRGLAGCVANVFSAEHAAALQRIAVGGSRLGIPLLIGNDVIHGFRTIFPIPLAEAATWDPVAVEDAAAIAAREAASAGTNWIYAPMVDIARDARWGRIAESAGEDPFLGSVLGAARVKGLQRCDWDFAPRSIACVKHFVAYGAAEGGRDYNTTEVSDATLRNVYFPPFQAALDAGVASIMASFNELNGMPVTASPHLLTATLRDEWHFDGICVSDYNAIGELLLHGCAATGNEAARMAILAGIDMDMQGKLYIEHLPQLVREGRVPMQAVDDAVRRILRAKLAMGLFDRPCVELGRDVGVILHPDHVQAALGVARKSIVLLKNQSSLLPLSKDIRHIAIIGPLADDPAAMLGCWSCAGKADDAVTVLHGIRNKLGRHTDIRYCQGCTASGEGDGTLLPERPEGCCAQKVEASKPGTPGLVPLPVPVGIAQAVEMARAADVAVLVVGETPDMSGEAHSRASIELPGRQEELIQAIHATGTPTVVVLMNGRPLAIPWIADNVPAILEAWHPGIQAGNAVADVLFGDHNPSAKLPVTFPRATGQVPFHYNHKHTGRPGEDKPYTSRYLDLPLTPQYPFGFGLSYTRFEYANLRMGTGTFCRNGPEGASHKRFPSPFRLRPGESLTLTADITNAGGRDGEEIVQLYIRDRVATPTRPVKELKGFQRLAIPAGQTRTVQFVLAPRDLGYWTIDGRFVTEPGAFQVWIGPNSSEGLESSFELLE